MSEIDLCSFNSDPSTAFYYPLVAMPIECPGIYPPFDHLKATPDRVKDLISDLDQRIVICDTCLLKIPMIELVGKEPFCVQYWRFILHPVMDERFRLYFLHQQVSALGTTEDKVFISQSRDMEVFRQLCRNRDYLNLCSECQRSTLYYLDTFTPALEPVMKTPLPLNQKEQVFILDVRKALSLLFNSARAEANPRRTKFDTPFSGNPDLFVKVLGKRKTLDTAQKQQSRLFKKLKAEVILDEDTDFTILLENAIQKGELVTISLLS